MTFFRSTSFQRIPRDSAEMCSGSEAGSYLRLIDFVSFDSRLESNKEEKTRFSGGILI